MIPDGVFDYTTRIPGLNGGFYTRADEVIMMRWVDICGRGWPGLSVQAVLARVFDPHDEDSAANGQLIHIIADMIYRGCDEDLILAWNDRSRGRAAFRAEIAEELGARLETLRGVVMADGRFFEVQRRQRGRRFDSWFVCEPIPAEQAEHAASV